VAGAQAAQLLPRGDGPAATFVVGGVFVGLGGADALGLGGLTRGPVLEGTLLEGLGQDLGQVVVGEVLATVDHGVVAHQFAPFTTARTRRRGSPAVRIFSSRRRCSAAVSRTC